MKTAKKPSSFKRVSVEDLTAAALDWAVAKCEGKEIAVADGVLWMPTERYHSDWSLAGPIIQREWITVDHEQAPGRQREWVSTGDSTLREDGVCIQNGPTPLIAAMRCYVACQLGEEISVPRSL